MEPDKLREWEQKCIQEEPPQCTATCPIHVDARAFVKEMGRGDQVAALKVLAKTMPFPGILGRICDHPCEQSCKRGEAGEAIAIGALERQCVETASQPVRPQMLPRKNLRIAIVGSGLSSLTVIWDLLRKGYDVTVFEPGVRLGRSLRAISEVQLPERVIDAELGILKDLGAEIQLGVAVDQPDFLTGLTAGYEAVFLDVETPGVRFNEQLTDDNGAVQIDVLTGATQLPGLFSGKGGQSPIYSVLEGRRAATSIDRHVTRVSMNSGREQEGSIATRLFTSLDGVAPLARLLPSDLLQGYTSDEAQQEAGRCMQCECMECVKVCAYLERFKGYPRKYAREIYNNERMVPGGVHRANLLVNSCSNCGLCATVCPNDFHMGELCHDARLSMVARGKMPPAAHEFALLDLEYSSSEKCALARHEPGMTSSSHLFFPSCQLAGSNPDQIVKAYGYLREQLTGGVGLLLSCCGAPALWAGRDDLLQNAIATLRQQWQELGNPAVILACSSCSDIFRTYLPEIQVQSLWEVVEEHGLPPHRSRLEGRQLAVADPCSSRHTPETQSSVRRLLRQLDVTVEELTFCGDKPQCCGYGGLMANANPALAREVVQRRISESDSDYLAYCAMCRDQLAASGKRAIHLAELIFPDDLVADPTARPATGWSQRHENKARLKERLLMELWNEQGSETGDYEGIALQIPAQVMARMEAQHILKADVQRVIEYAERSGNRLRNPETGLCRAYLRPHRVTFWVDYRQVGAEYVIENAYCHRMEIIRSSHE